MLNFTAAEQRIDGVSLSGPQITQIHADDSSGFCVSGRNLLTVDLPGVSPRDNETQLCFKITNLKSQITNNKW
jgi:hypothetical protein